MNSSQANAAVKASDDSQAAPEARAKALYDLGPTMIFASKIDPRFAYCMYVPPVVGEGGQVDLLVAIHGTSRTSFLDFRDGFAEFGRWNRCAILAPLFPVGVLGDEERSGYKYMQEGDIRYDKIVLGMVAEVAAKYRQNWDRFAIFGFSGGGHFAHRFAIMHPRRLWAASIGAPGSVTLLDTKRNWWVGVGDLEARFGTPFEPAEIAKIPFQMIVGEADLETWEITHKPTGKHYMEGANDAGKTRPERLRTLKASFESIGANVQLDVVPNVSHDRMKVLGRVKDFFAAVMQSRKGAA